MPRVTRSMSASQQRQNMDQSEPAILNPNEMTTLNDILAPLRGTVNQTNEALLKIEKLFENRFNRQQHEIDNLKREMRDLKENMVYHDHLIKLHGRKLDDQEQVSRKNNLRVKGIVVEVGDSPLKLKDYIVAEIAKLGNNIPVEDVDRVHRVGRPYTCNNKRVQDALIRFKSWHCRTLVYRARKELPFFLAADLTKRRAILLKSVNDEIVEGGSGGVVAFVFADENCKIKFKTKENKFHTISSELEFWTLVYRLDAEKTVSKEFEADETNRDKYSCYDEEETLNEFFY